MKASNRYKWLIPSGAVLLVVLIVCAIIFFGQGYADKPKPEDLAIEQFKSFSTDSDYHLSTNVTKTITVEGNVFTETRIQKISCTGYGSESVTVSAKETVVNGSREYQLSKHYKDGIGYLVMEDGSFSSACTFEEFYGGLVPYAPIDTSLYSSITAEKKDGSFLISLESPSQAEAWAIPEGADFVSAKATATVDKAGDILEITYTLDCKTDNAKINYTYSLVPLSETQVSVLPPKDSACMRLKYLFAPEVLETACGYLQQAVNVDSESKAETDSNAFGIRRTQRSKLKMREIDTAFEANVTTNITQVESGQTSETSAMKQEEIFKDGVYTVTVDNKDTNSVPSVTAETMKTYCQDILLGNILLPQYINEANNTSTNGTRTIHFNATKEMAAIICSNVSQTLYDDPTFLESVSGSIDTESLTCYLSVDEITGIPIGAGMNYEAAHKIDELPYTISYKFDQTYKCVSAQ